MTAIIRSIDAWEILDSRGVPTVACRVTVDGGHSAVGRVPAGSTNAPGEARDLRDGGHRYGGMGTGLAVRSIREVLAPRLIGVDAAMTDEVDTVIDEVDGTADLRSVGANAAMAVSVAAAKVAAKTACRPLYASISDSPLLPLPFVNLMFGDAHRTELQHLFCAPLGSQSVSEGLEWVWRVRQALTDLLAESGLEPVVVGNSHAGSGARIASAERALALTTEAIDRAGFVPGVEVAVGFDLAAYRFWDGKRYVFPHSGLEMAPGELLSLLVGWVERFNVTAVEDPFHPDHPEVWRSFTSAVGGGVLVVADRLTATNPGRLADFGSAANAVLVKPNQAGTVRRTRRFIEMARGVGLAVVMGSRAGSTEDSWSADMAIGWDIGYLKAGAATGSDRTAKWNRLLEAEAAGVISPRSHMRQ